VIKTVYKLGYRLEVES